MQNYIPVRFDPTTGFPIIPPEFLTLASKGNDQDEKDFHHFAPYLLLLPYLAKWPDPGRSVVVLTNANVTTLRNLASGMIKSLKRDGKSAIKNFFATPFRDNGVCVPRTGQVVNSWKDVENVIRHWEGEPSGWFKMSFEFVHRPSVKQAVPLYNVLVKSAKKVLNDDYACAFEELSKGDKYRHSVLRWSREALTELRRNLARWEDSKFGMSLRMKARDKCKEDGCHEVVMESFPRARMLVQKSKFVPPIIGPNRLKEKDIAHLLWTSGQSPITSFATRVCEFSKETGIELSQIFDKCRSIQGDQVLNACGFDDDDGSLGDFDSCSFNSLPSLVRPPRVSDENEKQPPLAQSHHGIQPPQHPPDLLQQLSSLLQQSHHGIQPPQHPPDLLQQLPSLLQQSIRNGTFHPVAQQQSVQEQPLQSIPQQPLQDNEMQSKAVPCPPVVPQPSRQDSPQAIEMQSKAVADQFEKKGIDPLHHFPCPSVVPQPSHQDSPQAIEMHSKAVADQFEKKGNNDKPTTHTKPPAAKNDADATKEKAEVYWNGKYYPIKKIINRQYKGSRCEYEVVWECGKLQDWVPMKHIPSKLYEEYDRKHPKKESKKRAPSNPKQNPAPTKIMKRPEKSVSKNCPAFSRQTSFYTNAFFTVLGW